MEFSKNDLSQIEEKGLSVKQVEEQVHIFKKGNVHVNVREAATTKSGIQVFSEDETEKLIGFYESRKDQVDILKFVPASGAATRMFKALFKFIKEYNPKKEELNTFLERKNDDNLLFFFHNLEKLPFYEQVQTEIENNFPNYKDATESQQKVIFVEGMLTEKGLNYANLPKGLVPFHKYEDKVTTAFEEHLLEATEYATSNGLAKLHFTVLENHRAKFEDCFQKIQDRIQSQTGTRLQVSYSYQDPKTDTVAVDMKNNPFRKNDGSILFRPGGHGALIDNLNKQDADIIFIKNIDNVVVPRFRREMSDCKKMLGGKLLELQEKIFLFLEKLETTNVSDEELDEMGVFMQDELNSGLSYDFQKMSSEEKKEVLKRKLNRPIRVCGMVKNEGEPGGGPFWVNHENGEISLQIVESAQIDMENYQQSKIVQEATHFNPVDLVCGVKDYKGNFFDFEKFVDPETSFISQKTNQGRELQALELPGLWNGAMADWITIFVEVPVETFNPVKTVSDLLRSRHQVRT